ncbi:DUF6153 family protein [Paenarthrobacter sp. TYUT067]|uniref:DUF6153 family protein n=1 Tax=Paenarthrobacter sp. TYUT067 TaxID=2926245 RepID=UPI00202F569E|nr:DUF6153 family protein [Paenarthrobacter sp. TYUT067]MCM0615501.1 DUF6153 family protein [Paenarthrobacter sp. TYUT067]
MSPSALLQPLRRASLLVLVFGVIAGIFGMHVVTDSHATHSAPATQALALHSAHLGHATPGSQAASTLHHPLGSSIDAQSCSSGSCSCAESTAEHCTPSLKTGSLVAPLPGSGAGGLADGPWATVEAPRAWTYLPPKPSLSQLSISRT